MSNAKRWRVVDKKAFVLFFFFFFLIFTILPDNVLLSNHFKWYLAPIQNWSLHEGTENMELFQLTFLNGG